MKTTSVGTEIVKRIAAREGVDPMDLDVLLYDVIDTDALEALANPTGDSQTRANLCVEFMYCGYAVTVGDNGRITIDEQPTEVKTGESSRKESVDD